MTAPDPEEEAWEARFAASKARRDEFAAQHGIPETMDAGEALRLARATVPVDPSAKADDVWASVYRDDAAADAWLDANLTHHGHPSLAKVPLPDGRVIGILDLRPSLERMVRNREEP